MSLDTGEELLADALGSDSRLTNAAQAIEPFIVPYDQLARLDGWVVWLGHPPVPAGLSLLPAPDHLLWDEPMTAVSVAAAVAADYAARRGARDADGLAEILTRESPVVVIVPGDVTGELRATLVELTAVGVPILDRPPDLADALETVPSFALRRAARSEELGRPHDPALSFQHIVKTGRAGGDAISTFVLHDDGKRDEVTVLGECGNHLGIEIGVRGTGITIEATVAIERQAARMPAFLSGVTSEWTGDSLEIGWRLDARPTAHELGKVFHIWLKALYCLELVDVRIAFAPANERSPVLSKMHARADAFRQRRAATMANDS